MSFSICGKGRLPRRVLVTLMLACGVLLSSSAAGVPSAWGDFGLVPGQTKASALNSDRTVDEQASSHPGDFTVHFALNTDSSGEIEGGEARDILFDPPAGLIGNPTAVPACPRRDFDGSDTTCPTGTQVGVLNATTNFGNLFTPVYNIVPPPGVPTMFGFNDAGRNVLQYASVRTEAGYILRVSSIDTPVQIKEATETLWGVPADPVHDPERFCRTTESAHALHPGCKSEEPLKAYLTMPADCDAPLQSLLQVDSKLNPGIFTGELLESEDAAGNPVSLAGCDAVPFDPSIASQATSRSAANPSGLEFELKLPDQGLETPGVTAETEPRKVVVTLPEGFTANPSFAEGITGCSEAQYKAERLETGPGEGCPESSKLGSVIAKTPLLEEAIEGSLYLASPYQNQFGSLLAIYMVLRAPERGVLVKQVGHVVPNETTGQLVTTFEDLPPIPYSSFHLHFREGARAPLATPPTCGTYKTVAQLTPFSSDEPVERVASFQIEHGSDGGACPSGGTPPFAPGLVAGTANNVAGAYSALDVRITRKDDEQEITGFTTQLPEGLTANLNGVPFCGEAAIALARTKSGSQEEAEPSCPAASEIGHTEVGVGVGTTLAYAPGKVYLGGPFEGAPFSIVSISAAKVGPFDLGTVVVHLPLQVDPLTAKVSIPQGPADQIPHIIKGIIVHVRDIQIYVDRAGFTSNPTSCAKTSFAATVYGSGQNFSSPSDDVPANVSSPFQAADCQALPFKPGFAASTSAKTSKADGASLTVKLTAPNQGPQNAGHEEANIHYVKVELPKQLPSRLTTLQKACTAAQFNANPAGCPAASVIGHARAVTPILPVPLEGPAYFVSNGGEAFPNLVLVLQGYGLRIDLVGDTFISKAGVTSSTFKMVPDQPVTSFELALPQGPYSALTANGNLCASELSMPAEFVAQNGVVIHQSTPIEVEGCPNTLAITGHTIKQKTLTVKVYVPAAGKVTITGKGVSSKSTTAKGRETLTIKVNQKKTGRLRTTVKALYTPSAGKDRKKQAKTLRVAFKK